MKVKKTLKTRIIAVTVVEVKIPFNAKKPTFSYERHGSLAHNLEFDFLKQENEFADEQTKNEWETLAFFVKTAESLNAKIDSVVYNKETHDMEFRLGFNSLSSANDFVRDFKESTNSEFIVSA